MGSKKNNLRVVRDAEDHTAHKGISKGAARRIMKNQRRHRVFVGSTWCEYAPIININNLLDEIKEDNHA